MHLQSHSGIRTCLALVLSLLAVSAPAYRNPFLNVGNSAGYAADPCALKWMGKYYLYHTDNYLVYESDDLVNWASRGRWAPTNLLGPYLWAPDPFYSNGVFYLYWSGPGGGHTILTAPSPLGPFQIALENAHPGIDGSVFRNDNGQLFFSWAGSNGIWYDQMTSPSAFANAPVHLTNCAVRLSGEGNWTEGPQIFQINGTYYMTYCGTGWSSPTYQVHAAKGDSVATLAAQTNNPILASLTGAWTGTGHNFVILGPDLMTYYTLYHARSTGATGDARRLMLDRIWVDSTTGNLISNGPTFTDQPNPSLPTWADAFDRASLGADWASEGPATWSIPAPKSVRGDSRGQATWSRLATATQTADRFAAEFNLRLVDTGTTSALPRYGVFVGYDGGPNGFSVFIDPANNRLSSYAVQNGTDLGWTNSALLPFGWDHTQWHTLRIAKLGANYDVFIDNMHRLSRTLDLKGGRIGFVVEDSQAEFSWTAFANRSDGPPNGMGGGWKTY